MVHPSSKMGYPDFIALLNQKAGLYNPPFEDLHARAATQGRGFSQ